jgi:hypothetical protein
MMGHLMTIGLGRGIGIAIGIRLGQKADCETDIDPGAEQSR